MTGWAAGLFWPKGESAVRISVTSGGVDRDTMRSQAICSERIDERLLMITLYHSPLSINSRRVWVALLEKGLTFDLQEVNLAGDQYKPEFLAMNPFHHIPVLVDGAQTVIESFAILDYLDAQYPTPPLMPQEPAAIALVRMVQMVTLNELMPAVTPLTQKMMGFGEPDPEAIAKALQQGRVCLQFFVEKLGDRAYFGGDHITLADVVLGTVAPWFDELELPLTEFPTLAAWCDRLMQREAWHVTQPTPEMIAAFRERMRAIMAARQKGLG